MLFLRAGVKRIEFEKGKSAIVLATIDDLSKTIKGLMDATSNGELDHLLDAKVPQSLPARKKAA
jgi:hypothetical protein